MWRVTIKGLLAHKLRLALTALAIVLGVTFIAGTFVLTDTLHNTFDNLFGNIYQNVDLPGARRGPVRQRRHRHPQSGPGVAPRHGSRPSPAWRPPTAR